MSKTLRFSFTAIVYSVLFLQAIALSQDAGTPEKLAENPKAPVRKTIDRQELKRLIAEKLAAKADPELIQLLLDQARSGEKRSLDPLANREAFEKLLVEMEELKEITAKVRKDTVGDLVDQSPTEPIEIVVNQTVNRLKARLGGDSQGSLEIPKELSRHPIPEYANTPLLLQKVNALLKTQVGVGKALATDQDGLKPGEKNEAVAAMILSQESLAWEAAWPYTPEEVKLIEEAGGKIPREVYLGRLSRGLATLNEKVADERASVGRGKPARQFVLYRPVAEEAAKPIDDWLVDLRGHGDAWKELAVPFDAEAEKFLAIPDGNSD